MKDKDKNIFIITGEASGDMHASSLVKQLNGKRPDIKYFGIGGSFLQNENVKLIHNYNEINFIGFSSVIKNLPKIQRVLSDTINFIRELNPDLIILVDFPGFNLKLAEKIRRFYSGKIIYYISPQLWAWHKSRVKKIKKYVDRMLVVFPFEVDFYEKENIKADYVGHPLLSKIEEFLKSNSKTESDKIRIGLLPGSRQEEVQRILPTLADVSDKFKEEFDAKINILCSDNLDESIYKNILGKRDFNLIRNSINDNAGYQLMLNSELLFTKSGTSTLECALIGTPFCVVYNTTPFNYLLGKKLIKVEHLAMVNILSGKKIVKEFIQKDFNSDNLYTEGKKLLTDVNYRKEMTNNFIKLKSILTQSVPSSNASDIICSYLK